MNISKALPNEIDSIMSLIKAAIQKMDREGIYQWDEIYPSRDLIYADIAANSLFVTRIEKNIAGIIVLNEEQSTEYNNIIWKDIAGKSLIFHRLCVSPAFQGQGVAKKLLLFSENYARENKYSSIRLDAFINNPVSVGLYDSLGYQRRGVVRFRKGDFYCYEKVLLEKLIDKPVPHVIITIRSNL